MLANEFYKHFYDECCNLENDDIFNISNFINKTKYNHSSFYREFINKEYFLQDSINYILKEVIFKGNFNNILLNYYKNITYIRKFINKTFYNKKLNPIFVNCFRIQLENIIDEDEFVINFIVAGLLNVTLDIINNKYDQKQVEISLQKLSKAVKIKHNI